MKNVAGHARELTGKKSTTMRTLQALIAPSVLATLLLSPVAVLAIPCNTGLMGSVSTCGLSLLPNRDVDSHREWRVPLPMPWSGAPFFMPPGTLSPTFAHISAPLDLLLPNATSFPMQAIPKNNFAESSLTWTNFSIVPALNTGQDTLDFIVRSRGTDSRVDGEPSTKGFRAWFSEQAVPEPSSLMLLGLGVVVLVGYNFRYRRYIGPNLAPDSKRDNRHSTRPITIGPGSPPACLRPSSVAPDGLLPPLHRTRLITSLCDVVTASTLLVLAAPVAALTVLAIWAEGSGPVLYRQTRVGLRGVPFEIFKFRSMRTDAERDGTPQWAAENDSRITRVGRFIRKTRIDEIPQLINVMKGEMNLIGPRPERPHFVETLSQEIPRYALRHTVKPGITGWAQVRYGYAASLAQAERKLDYDLFYVSNHNLLLDLRILFETVRIVLTARGAR